MQNASFRLNFPFSVNIPNGGYAWWYVDIIGEDKETTLTIIFFLGSVFSPSYFKTRKKIGIQNTNPLFFPAINVSLRNQKKHLWCFTDKDFKTVSRSPHHLAIGSSRLEWKTDYLEIKLKERTKPFFERMEPKIAGTVKLYPNHVFENSIAVEPTQKHLWFPIAPFSKAEVNLENPKSQWVGSAYHDGNFGIEPIEQGFSNWSWSRSELQEGTAVIYDTVYQKRIEKRGRLDVQNQQNFLFTKQGEIKGLSIPNTTRLPKDFWGIERKTRAQNPNRTQLLQTLESSPFYCRSLIQTELMGQTTQSIHESLDLNRFKKTWVQKLLPWKIRKEKLTNNNRFNSINHQP